MDKASIRLRIWGLQVRVLSRSLNSMKQLSLVGSLTQILVLSRSNCEGAESYHFINSQNMCSFRVENPCPRDSDLIDACHGLRLAHFALASHYNELQTSCFYALTCSDVSCINWDLGGDVNDLLVGSSAKYCHRVIMEYGTLFSVRAILCEAEMSWSSDSQQGKRSKGTSLMKNNTRKPSPSLSRP